MGCWTKCKAVKTLDLMLAVDAASCCALHDYPLRLYVCLQAMDPNCNLLDETIGKAALKAEDALKVLQVTQWTRVPAPARKQAPP